MQPAIAPRPPAGTRFPEIVLSEQSNHHGTLFGRTTLDPVSMVAFAAPDRCARRAVVTAGSGDVEFHAPLKVGQVVESNARVSRIGGSPPTVNLAFRRSPKHAASRSIRPIARSVTPGSNPPHPT